MSHSSADRESTKKKSWQDSWPKEFHSISVKETSPPLTASEKKSTKNNTPKKPYPSSMENQMPVSLSPLTTAQNLKKAKHYESKVLDEQIEAKQIALNILEKQIELVNLSLEENLLIEELEDFSSVNNINSGLILVQSKHSKGLL